MSYQVVNAVLAHSKATGSDRLVLMVLATHADKDTFDCHPGRDLLCKEAAMSERSLIRCLNELEKLKEITVHRGSGRGNLSSYTINLPRVEEAEKVTEPTPILKAEKVTKQVKKVTSLTPFQSDKGCQITSERVTFQEKRVTDQVEKGDISRIPYKEEPSWNQEETIMNQKDMSGAVAPAVPSPVQEVFAYWQTRLNHPQAHLTDKRRKLIQARLKEKYTVEQIKLAIDGCASSPFHMGQNDRQTVYDDIELICRDGGKLEGFISKLNQPNGSNGNGRNQVPHRETHNERAFRESFELIEQAIAPSGGFDSPDPEDSATPWTACLVGGL